MTYADAVREAEQAFETEMALPRGLYLAETAAAQKSYREAVAEIIVSYQREVAPFKAAKDEAVRLARRELAGLTSPAAQRLAEATDAAERLCSARLREARKGMR